MREEPQRPYEPAPDDASTSEGSLSPREILTAVRRRWWVVLVTFLAILGIGLWRTLRQPLLYKAAVTVRFQQVQAPIAGMQTPGAARMSYSVDPMQSEQMLIKSQKVAELVVHRLGLRLQVAHPSRLPISQLLGGTKPVVDSAAPTAEYRLDLGEKEYSLSSGTVRYGPVAYGDTLKAPGLRFVLPHRPSVRESPVILEVAPLRRVAGNVRGSVSTRVLPQTDIVEISYITTDPVMARDIANAVAYTYADFSSDGQRSSARSKSAFISQSLKDQAAQLALAQDELKRFKEANQTSDVATEITALFNTIHNFENERRSALVEREVYKQLVGKLAQADTADDDLRKLAGTEAITKNTYIANLYTRWFDLLKDREDLLAAGKTPANNDVQTVDKLIQRTKRDLQFASRDYLQGIQSRLQSYDQTIAELRQQGERYPPLEAEQARLSADVRTAQRTYDDLMSQYQVARIAESADVGLVRIIDEAETPTFAVAPSRRRAAAFSMMLGLLLGVGLALGLERLDNSVKSPDELQEQFQLTVLGLIPAIRLAEQQETQAGPMLSRLVTHVDPRSPVAESYRSLRTNLAYARAHQRLQAIVLTSPGPADGKSTTVANLAITFAQQGQRTLLIDADLRRSVLDKTFGIPRSPGLTEVIIGTAPLTQAIQPTDVANLSVLGSGQLPPNPSELLGSPEMRAVLGEARRLYDIVLIDSPPLLAVTDAAVLSTIVDGTVLVVRMGSTAKEAVRRALSLLRAVHTRVLGAVLNHIDYSVGTYYSKYGYYSYSYYGSEPGTTNGRGRSMLERLRGRGARSSGKGQGVT